jgi:hypothetical protein
MLFKIRKIISLILIGAALAAPISAKAQGILSELNTFHNPEAMFPGFLCTAAGGLGLIYYQHRRGIHSGHIPFLVMASAILLACNKGIDWGISAYRNSTRRSNEAALEVVLAGMIDDPRKTR